MVDHFHQHAVVIDHLTGLRITAETHSWVSEMMYPGRLNQGGKIRLECGQRLTKAKDSGIIKRRDQTRHQLSLLSIPWSARV